MSRYRLISLMILASFAVLLIVGCSSSPEDIYLGDWERVEKSQFGPEEDWATISKQGDTLYWEDSNGKFPATLANDELAIDVGGFPAAATFDRNKEILTYSVHGTTILYKRKE